MNYFKSEEHYVNYIRSIIRDKFDVYVDENWVKVLRAIYQTDNYKNLFKAFNLKSFHKTISWELRNLKNNDVEILESFLGYKLKLLKQVKLFIEDTDNLYSSKCKELLDYCKYEKVIRLERKQDIYDMELGFVQEKFSKGKVSDEAIKIFEVLIDKAGVYLIYDKNKKLVYIGKSYTLSSRILSSIKERKGSYFSYIITENKIDADILEPYLIGTLKPALNGDFMTDDKPSFELPIPKKSELVSIFKEN